MGDLTVDVTVPTACADRDTNLSLRPVTGYQLYIDDALHGTVVTRANAFEGLTLANGVTRSAWTPLAPGDTTSFNVADFKPGGKVTITVTFDCGSCVVPQ